MFVDPFESFGWRMAFTTREKELLIREMNIITGAKKYCLAYFVAEVLCTVCRSVRIIQMENGIHDPRKIPVDPKSESH